MRNVAIAFMIVTLAACSASQPVTTENAAKAMEGDLANRAAELDANVNAEANKAAAAAMAEATAQAATMGNATAATANAQ